MHEFNVTGVCIPSKHYMADISDKVSQIAAMVEKGQYKARLSYCTHKFCGLPSYTCILMPVLAATSLLLE